MKNRDAESSHTQRKTETERTATQRGREDTPAHKETSTGAANSHTQKRNTPCSICIPAKREKHKRELGCLPSHAACAVENARANRPRAHTHSHPSTFAPQRIRENNKYPTLMQCSEAWTRLVPYKEQAHFRGASDSIANAYSPAAQHLRTKDLAPYVG